MRVYFVVNSDSEFESSQKADFINKALLNLQFNILPTDVTSGVVAKCLLLDGSYALSFDDEEEIIVSKDKGQGDKVFKKKVNNGKQKIVNLFGKSKVKTKQEMIDLGLISNT